MMNQHYKLLECCSGNDIGEAGHQVQYRTPDMMSIMPYFVMTLKNDDIRIQETIMVI